MPEGAPVEKTAQEKQLDNLQQLHQAMWNDTSTRGQEYRAKAKELFPETVLPEDVTAVALAPMQAKLDEMAEQLKAERDERAAERTAADEASRTKAFEDGADAARTKYSLTPEGFDKMIERMKATGNFSDFEASAAWVAGQTPPPVNPGPYLGPQALNLFGSKDQDEQFALLHKDPEGSFLDGQFREFMADPRQYVLDAGIQPDF